MADDATLAHISKNAYSDSDFGYNGFRLVDGGLIEDSDTSTKVIALVSPSGEMVLAFEGSKQPLDWWYNMRVDYRAFGDYGKVHAGFLKSWLAVAEQLVEIVAKHNPEGLTITGHSRGGAIAVLAALELKQTAPRVRVVTFGAPRPGNKEFHRSFQKAVPDVRRFWLFSDPVPFVPFLKWGYRQVHGGQILFAAVIPHIMNSYVTAVVKRQARQEAA